VTQDDVIEMAQEVGMDYLQFISLESMEKVIRFVNLVEIRAATKEKEDIIKAIESLGTWAHIEEVVNTIRGLK
jgi:glutamine phosphoribosylpyrophosphate amidotransferase